MSEPTTQHLTLPLRLNTFLGVMFSLLVCLLTVGLVTSRSCDQVNGISGACSLTLNQFTFAGAHNAGAGAFGSMWHWSGIQAGGCWYANQDKSITQMLNIGIRYFDFDVAYIEAKHAGGGWWEEGIVLVHDNAYSRSLKRALVEIDNFLGSHPDEIVIIRIKDYASWARGLIRDNLVKELAVFSHTGLNGERNPTLGSAITNNERVFVFVNGALGYGHNNIQSLEQIESWMDAGASFSCWSEDDVYNKLRGDSQINSTYYQVQVDWYQSYGLCNYELAGLCDGNELNKLKTINQRLVNATKRPVNLILIDYVGYGSPSLSEVVKAMNIENVKTFA